MRPAAVLIPGCLLTIGLALPGGTGPACAQSARPRIAFDPATTYQTIDGWEATLDIGSLLTTYPQSTAEALRKIVDDVGINRVRLEIRAGSENTRASWKEWQDSPDPAAGSVYYQRWRGERYATVNDNSDPDVFNWNGFHFDEIDHTVETLLLPIKDRLESNGETLQVNLCYVAFTGQNAAGSSYDHDDPAEYAEFVLATFLHLRDTWDIVPDTFEMILEPDNTQEWTGNLIGRAMVETDRRLSAEGFHPGYVAPSTTSMFYAHRFFDDIAKVSGATDLMTELSYHRYQHTTTENLQEVVDRAKTYGLKTAQLEWIGADYHTLHEDLTDGMNSSWSQYVVAYNQDTGGAYLLFDVSGASPVMRLASRTRYLCLYFLWVRQGAVRVRATSTDSALDPLGFVNEDDRPTVVVKATGSRNFDVAGLPAGTYGIRYATSSQESVDLTDVHIDDGEVVPASIPAAGVITVYAKSLDSAPPPPPQAPQIVGASPQGTDVTVVADTLRTFSVTAQDPQALPLTYSWTVDGAAAGSTGPALDHTPSVVGTDVVAVTVSNGTEQVQRTWNVDVVASITVHDLTAPPPTIALPPAADPGARRVLEFSADGAFAKPRVRMKVKKGLLAVVPGKRDWLDVLRLGAGGGAIHARVVYPDDDIVEVLEDSIVSAAVDPVVVSPADATELSRGQGPEVEFTAAATRKTWLEFSATSDFAESAGTAPLRKSPGRVNREAWKRVLSKLKRKGSPDGGFYRLAHEDLIGRTTRSAARTFQLPPK